MYASEDELPSAELATADDAFVAPPVGLSAVPLVLWMSSMLKGDIYFFSLGIPKVNFFVRLYL